MILCTGLFPHSIVHVQMRHRVPFLDLPLVLLAAVTVGSVIRSLFRAGKPARRDD